MTDAETSLVRRSFAQVVPVADQVGALFYARLFELDPALRGWFRGDMAGQGRQLMQALGYCVAHLDRPAALGPAVRALGLRHATERLRAEQYETVGAALLWSLEKILGAAFTAETRAAWARLYWLLAELMKTGARDGAARQARLPGSGPAPAGAGPHDLPFPGRA